MWCGGEECETDLRPASPYPSSQGHTQTVNCISVTVDGLRAVSGSEDKTLRVWDLATGACLRTLQVKRGAWRGGGGAEGRTDVGSEES